MIITFEGRQHSFPDDFTDADIAAALASEKPSAREALTDIAKSTGIGAAKSIIGLADIPELGARGIHAGVNLVQRTLGMEQTPRPGTTARNFEDRFTGVTPEKPEVQPAFPLPSAAQIQSKIEERTGPFYQPKTYGGEWAETIGG